MNCTRSGIWAPPTLERSEEHTSELQSRLHLVCRLLLEKKKKQISHLAFAFKPELHAPHHQRLRSHFNVLPTLTSSRLDRSYLVSRYQDCKQHLLVLLQ